MNPPEDFSALRRVSARLGRDPLLVQSAGGNTSVKADGVMWIKASGTLLAQAETQDIFVPVDLPAVREWIATGEVSVDRPADFALVHDALRPSVETSLHAVFPQRFVLHVHCVRTIAFAVRQDARERLAEKLSGFDWAFAEYIKPGIRLAHRVRDALKAKTDVIALGNHGLIVAGDSAEEAEEKINAFAAALEAPIARAPAPDIAKLRSLAGGGYEPAPADHPLNVVALLPRLTAIAIGGSLYPDHLVFCGPAATALAEGENAARVAARFRERGLKPPPFVLAPGAGALIFRDASAGGAALARCLGDVLIRIPEDAPIKYFTEDETRDLMEWDAEKYRQALNAQ